MHLESEIKPMRESTVVLPPSMLGNLGIGRLQVKIIDRFFKVTE